MPLKTLLDRHEKNKGKNNMIEPDEYEEVNIGLTEDPKMIEIEKTISGVERRTTEISSEGMLLPMMF